MPPTSVLLVMRCDVSSDAAAENKQQDGDSEIDIKLRLLPIYNSRSVLCTALQWFAIIRCMVLWCVDCGS